MKTEIDKLQPGMPAADALPTLTNILHDLDDRLTALQARLNRLQGPFGPSRLGTFPPPEERLDD